MLRLSKFSGEIPRLIPRLLPDTYSQFAQNTKLENGALMPIRRARYEHRLSSVSRTIYRTPDGSWLRWPGIVNVVPAPIAENRLYVTGDGAPKMIVNGSTTYNLALPRPTVRPTASLNGEVDEDLSLTLLYAYTWVTEYGEESEPSPLSNPLLFSEKTPDRSLNQLILTGIAAPPSGRGFNKIRLYRAQTSALGDTNLHFEAEFNNTGADRTLEYFPLLTRIGEPIPSTDYNPPPAGLRGLTALPNGMMAAFMGKKVYFSEPYRPHAWPEKYILTVDYEVVGLGAFASSLAILTKGQPYIATGATPDAMVMEKMAATMPCLSMHSIVDLGDVIAYASPEGLVTVSNAGVQLVSRNLFTREQWNELNPSSFVCGQFGGRYMASYAHPLPEGGERRGMIIIDLTGETPFLVRAGDDADAMFTEPGTGTLYILRNGRDIWEWDALSEPYGEVLWKSKRYVLPGHTNFGAILIEGEGAVTDWQKAKQDAENAGRIARNRARLANGNTGGSIADAAIGIVPFAGSLMEPIDTTDVENEQGDSHVAVTVIANGKPVAIITDMNRVMRLPSGFLADTWEFEVRGNMMITAISVAGSPSELATG